jgi:Lipopolysaccharide-assembly, LptC-related
MRAAALTVGGLLVLAACNPQPPKATPSPALRSAAPHGTPTPLALTVTGQGTASQPVRVFQQVHNRVDYDLIASSYEGRSPQGSWRSVFQNARVRFRDQRGSTITATAPQAVVDEATNTVTLLSGVHARTASGMTLQCDKLVYDRGRGMFHGEGNVIIRDPKGFRATGSRFDSDISLTHIRMQ